MDASEKDVAQEGPDTTASIEATEAEEATNPPTLTPLVISSKKFKEHLQPAIPSPLSAIDTTVPTTSLLPQAPVGRLNDQKGEDNENAGDDKEAEVERADNAAEDASTPHISEDLWLKVLAHVESEKDFLALASSSKPLHATLSDPVVVATSTTYLAVYNAYRRFPTLLTAEVLRQMLSMGAHVPRYLALLVGYQHKELVAKLQELGSSRTAELGDFEPHPTDHKELPLAGKKSVEAPPLFNIQLDPSLQAKSRLRIETIHFIVWIGTYHYGNLFGFDPNDASATPLSPKVRRQGDDASAIALRATRMRLFRQTLEWIYNIPGAALPGSPVNALFEVNKANADYPPSDAEVFAYMMSLYVNADDGPAVSTPVASSPHPSQPTSRMPPASSASRLPSNSSSVSSSPKPLPSSIMPPSKNKPMPPKPAVDAKPQQPVTIPGKSALDSREKLKTANRGTIVASLRELCNVYRFTPGLIAASLPAGWLPVGLFEQDVELAWFLIRHSGEAKPAFLEKDADAVALLTLLGYKIHLNLTHPSLPPTNTDEYFPIDSIKKLVQQGRMRLTDKVLYALLSVHTTPLVISRLIRLGIDVTRLTKIGAVLLKECFDGDGIIEKLAAGHTGLLFHRADTVVAAFNLSKAVIAECFMGDPDVVPGDPLQQIVLGPLPNTAEWDEIETVEAARAMVDRKKAEGKDKPSTTGSVDATNDAASVNGGGSRPGTPSFPATGSVDNATAPTNPANVFPEVPLLTRLARAVGYLPWVAWQWAIKYLGAAHPVASACLHDACVRTFPDPAPINPGSPDALSFARKEADAAVKTMLSMGVRAQLCTAVHALHSARLEIEAATASGDAAQAIRVQAASLKRQVSSGVSKAAQKAAENATAAGAKAISRRFVYVLADVEKLLLGHGPDDFNSGRVLAPEVIEASDQMVLVEYQAEKKESEAEAEANETSKASDAEPATPMSFDATPVSVEAPVTSKPSRALMHLYPTTLLPQHRSVWLLALRTLIVESEDWRLLTASPVSPNAGRRFYIAASNIVRGLEQFGVPAAAFAALRARSPGGKALKSMSSNDSRETMLFVSWMDEMLAEEAESGLKGGVGAGVIAAKVASPL
ncbi:hypothetical protein HDU96_000818 [Phlyctochytrium bullatum]|nr:hypothetical protein HDU96_000818 [Phlyctochytrium bullatum]